MALFYSVLSALFVSLTINFFLWKRIKRDKAIFDLLGGRDQAIELSRKKKA